MARLPLLALGILSLLVGLAGGLVRMGWGPVPLPPGAVLEHGPLMVAGFLATVIGLEKAVAYGWRAAYAAPLCTGTGALWLAAGGSMTLGRALVATGAASLLATLAFALQRYRTRWTAAQAVGAACLAAGSVLWLASAPFYAVLPWWEAFVVLTIAGERLELSRLLNPGRRALVLFAALVGLAVASAALSLPRPDIGVRTGGVAWLGIALWLARWDLARLSLRRPGLPRFMAFAVLSGHAWLAVAGILALGYGALVAGLRYDAPLHALFLGFAFAMIFGHAPVIFPSVLGLRIEFRPRFWAHLVLLHASVAMRVAGDLAGSAEVRALSGLVGAAAILLFVLQTVTSLRRP